MKKIGLNIKWEILCLKPSKIWLALPIQTPEQKILHFNISEKPIKKNR